MKPVCVPCRRFFKPKKNGFEFVEGAPKYNGAAPGLTAPDQWRPYKLWMGDLWECLGCGAQVIVGIGRGPISEHFHPDFSEMSARHGADKVQVNDC